MNSKKRRGVFVILALAAAIVVGGGVMSAQRIARDAPAEQGPFGALNWRNIGPLRGGRSQAVAGSAARPLEYYFGATGGGLWKTTDGGTTWQPVTDGQIHSSSVGAVAVAPSNPDVVFIGTGETELRGNIIQGDGVYKSVDGGKTWAHSGLDDSQAIAKIRIDPSNPDVVYVAAFGHPYGRSEQRGVFKSSDGGATWQKVLYRDDKTGAIDLVIDPTNPSVVYASLWEAFRTSYSMSSGGPGSGLFKSVDGGEHWTELSHNPGLPKGTLGKIGIAVSGADGQRVYAQIEAEDGGFFSSDDGGATWTKVTDRRDLRQRAFYYTRVYADPKAKDTVYVLNVGFHKSTDGGKTWKSLQPPHGDNHDLWIAPDDSARMIEANDGGANVSVNGGETWTDQDFSTAQFYHVITTTHVPYHVCGAQQDNSTACVSSVAPRGGPGGSGGAADRVFYSVGGGESGYIASDPRNPDIFYAGSYGGLITRLDRRTGEERQINPYPDNPMGYSSEDIVERFQWTTPIVLSPIDPSVLYVGSQHVWKSTDEGQSWTKISPDLTKHDPSTMGPSGGPITKDQTGVETFATVFTIAPSPKDPNLIWTGSDDGLVFVTRDGGKNWTNVTPPALPNLSRISLVEASPFRTGTAYVAANHYQADDFTPYVYRTDDYGKTWTPIVNGIAPRDFARAVREDPQREKLLYLGTEHGIYVSFDDGAQWESLRQNLPDTPVHDIKVEQRDLVIATHGRGFYIMDDIAPLRQWRAPATMTSELQLFKPADALRGLDRAASIDYMLKSPAEKVTIEIVDPQGKTIRTFTSAEAERGAGAPAERDRGAGAPGVNEEDEGIRRPPEPKPSTKAGLHRLRWDLRYPGATEFPGLIMWAASRQGPVAPPGTYTVKVTADRDSASEKLVVRREPHLLAGVSDEDLQKQFDLAMQVRDAVSKANEGVLLIRGIKPQLQDRIGKLQAQRGGGSSTAVAAARALDQKLSAIEQELYQVKNQSSQDPLNYPIKLNNRIAALQSVIESSDSKPTQASYDIFKMLSGLLDARLEALDAAVKTDLPKLNSQLRKQKLAPVAATPLSGADQGSRGPTPARSRSAALRLARASGAL